MLTSIQNERVKLVKALQAQRKTREEKQCFVVEGVRLVEEALKTKAEIDFVFYEDTTDPRAQKLLEELNAHRVNLIQVAPTILRACADTEAPQPILAVVKQKPRLEIRDSISDLQSLVLICDRLSDPGNLGTLLRSAAACGVTHVWLAPETVEAYNPKVIRAGMGAHFRLNLEALSWGEITARINGIKVWLADVENATPYDQVAWQRPCALIISGEAEGPSSAARTLASESVFIPMQNGVESLNAAVAGSIILFEAIKNLG